MNADENNRNRFHCQPSFWVRGIGEIGLPITPEKLLW